MEKRGIAIAARMPMITTTIKKLDQCEAAPVACRMDSVVRLHRKVLRIEV